MARRAARASISVIVVSALAACAEAFVSEPTSREVQAAMQVLIADRDGSLDAKGRYKGPLVRNIRDLKCKPIGKIAGVYSCAFEYDYTEGRSKETEKTEKVFHMVPVKLNEQGKEVERKLWRVKI